MEVLHLLEFNIIITLDVIGYRLISELSDGTDDFQTEQDKVNKKEFLKKKAEEKKKK